jgi:hypothetical protein
MKSIKTKKSKDDVTQSVSPETADFIRRVRMLTKEMCSSKEKSREFLVSTGIYDKDGNLTKRYR